MLRPEPENGYWANKRPQRVVVVELMPEIWFAETRNNMFLTIFVCIILSKKQIIIGYIFELEWEGSRDPPEFLKFCPESRLRGRFRTKVEEFMNFFLVSGSRVCVFLYFQRKVLKYNTRSTTTTTRCGRFIRSIVVFGFWS